MTREGCTPRLLSPAVMPNTWVGISDPVRAEARPDHDEGGQCRIGPETNCGMPTRGLLCSAIASDETQLRAMTAALLQFLRSCGALVCVWVDAWVGAWLDGCVRAGVRAGGRACVRAGGRGVEYTPCC
jgi:hypothetical protein